MLTRQPGLLLWGDKTAGRGRGGVSTEAALTEIDWSFRQFEDTIAGNNIFFSEAARNESDAPGSS